MNAFLSQSELEAMDDMARFGCKLTDAELDEFIEGKKRLFDVEIRKNGHVIGHELNVRAMCSMDVLIAMQDLYGLNVGFKVVAK